MDIDLRQFGEIPPVTRDEWEASVARALGSQTLERLQAVTSDGFSVPTLGSPRSDRPPTALRGPGKPWSIVQRVTMNDASTTNAVILDELTNGADAIDVVFPKPATGEAEASAFASPSEGLVGVFEGVYLDMIPVHFTGAGAILNLANILLSVAESNSRAAGSICIHPGHDPIVHMMHASYEGPEKHAEFDTFYREVRALASLGVGGTWASARGQAWHALGASEVQQVAVAIATGVFFLEGFRENIPTAVPPAALSSRIEFRLVADQNQFLTVAKLRAFRRLWALVLDEWGLPPVPAFVHAETAWKMMTRRDPWVNILRTTIATAGAALGGADAITTVPHTAVLGMPDAAARRLSRNVQAVLMEESNLHRVTDPAAGAGAIEDLTDRIAEGAWAEFRTIMKSGGIVAAIEDGSLLGRIAEKEAAREKAVARRRIPVTGTSTYPFLAERVAESSGAPAFPAPAPRARRTAEPWETLRDRSDAALAETGRRPLVFLANLGPVAAFTARATWAKNLFEAGGIEAVGRDGHLDAAAAAAAFAASGATIACLCSDDRTYAALAGETAAALKAAGASRILLAGRPPEGDGAFDATGVDQFVHEGLDMVAVLTDLHEMLATPATA